MTQIIVYSDLYNAFIFADLNKEKARWVRDAGGWFIFNGKYWEKDSREQIKSMAIDTFRTIATRLAPLDSFQARNHIKKSASNGALNSMVDCAKAFLSYATDDLDKDHYAFNCRNGTYNLQTKEFYPFRASDMMTKTGYAEYKPDDVCPLWEKFIDEIFLGDKELIAFAQRIIGYSMTGLNKEQCMFILYGHGRNGKSKLIEAVVNILGDYAMNCPSSTFAVKQGNPVPNDVARLKGARMVTAIESNQGINLDESMVKQMTGGDRITARFLNKEFFEFTPTFKIFFATNHKPNIRGTDTGIWRRISMIPFDLNVTEEQEDKQLGEKLQKEASGILNWMIRGYNQWESGGLQIPEKVRLTTNTYKEEEDDIGEFIKQECTYDKKGVIVSHEFRERFKEAMGYYKGHKTMNEYMTRHGYKAPGDNRVMVKGKQVRAYVNLKWNDGSSNQPEITWQE